MNRLQIFENKEFGQIRTVQLNNETYFVGKDVAEALQYNEPHKAITRHVEDDDRMKHPITDETGRNQDSWIINESGMYSLILGSKLESAKRFKHWVTSEVLPSIRKTGQYQQTLTPQEIMRIQLGMIDDHEERIVKLESNMTIDYGQQRVLGNLVNQRVIECLDGKESEAYKAMGKKVFAECNRDIKNYFNVNSRNNIPKKRFDEAVEYVKNWEPCTNTKMLIRQYNSQLTLEV